MTKVRSGLARVLLISLVSSMALLPGGSHAQYGPYERQVRDQLLAASYALLSAGYEFTHEPLTDKLSRGERYDITINLDPGVAYAIVGVCDNDCTDMDLELWDSKGRLMDSDLSPSDTPIVQVVPGYFDQFFVRVTIPRCHAWQCTFAVGVFGR